MAGERPRRRLLAWLGRALAALTAGYVAFLTVEGSRRLRRPPRRAFLPFVEGDALTPADLGLPYEEVRLTTDDGVTLSGWPVAARHETRSAVILMHGFS